MTRRLLVSALPGERRAAWLKDGRLADLVILRDDRPSLLGNLYLGRVTAVERPRGLAFVTLGLARDAILPLSEAPGRRPSEGDALVVRLVREPEADKGARVSAKIATPPRDLEALARQAKPPALLQRGDDPIARLMSEGSPPDEILIDDLAVLAETKARLSAAAPELLPRVAHDREARPLFDREGLEEQIDALLRPRVALPSGGSLLIEPVRTLTAIDVNSGGHDAGGAPEDLALAVDLEAAAALARQIRLRALSGLIVVDFLALSDAGRRKAVVAALRDGLKGDPEPHRVGPMAASGLVEVTRRRGRPPLHELLTQPCGPEGCGRTKDPVTLAYEALRALAREAAAQPTKRLRIEADPPVAAALQGPAAAARAGLAERCGRAIAVDPRPAAPAAAYDLVLE